MFGVLRRVWGGGRESLKKNQSDLKLSLTFSTFAIFKDQPLFEALLLDHLEICGVYHACEVEATNDLPGDGRACSPASPLGRQAPLLGFKCEQSVVNVMSSLGA